MSTIPATRSSALDFTALAASLALCFAVADLGGYWTSLGLGPWYDGLRKPTWTPPNRVFGPVWIVLYASMAVAAWLVWRRRGTHRIALPLGLFALQLALTPPGAACSSPCGAPNGRPARPSCSGRRSWRPWWRSGGSAGRRRPCWSPTWPGWHPPPP